MNYNLKNVLIIMLLLLSLPVLSACDETKKDSPADKDAKETEKTKESEIEYGFEEGKTAIDFELKAFTNNKVYKLSDYIGKKPIVINFFVSYLEACRMELPELNGLYQEYEDDELMVFSINLGNTDSKADVEKLISDYILSYPVLIDEHSDIAIKYKAENLPVNLFIDKNGIIKRRVEGMQTKESFEKNVKELLAE